MVFSRSMKYLSIAVVMMAILYKAELPLEQNTWLLTKVATVHYDRTHVYRILTNIDKYPQWYPNVVRVEHIQLVKSRVHNHEGEKYRLYTKFPLIGELASSLSIHTDDQGKRFAYSLDSWLLETDTIELKDNPVQANSTKIEWTVHTRRRSVLFQYLILPFAKFYKNQIVREALFTLIMQIRDL